MNDCPEWNEPYGTFVSSASGSVECPDGGSQQFQLLGLPISTVIGDPADPTEHDNRTKRFKARVDETKRNWNCD